MAATGIIMSFAVIIPAKWDKLMKKEKP